MSNLAVLTEDDVREIKRLLEQGSATKKAIGSMFGVSHGAVWHIAKRNSWAWTDAIIEQDMV